MSVRPVPTPRSRRARTVPFLALLLATGGVAFATEGETYPERGDDAVDDFVASWKSVVPVPIDELCTGEVTRSGSESTFRPDDTTPNVPPVSPLGVERADGSREHEERGGGDTDDRGADSFLYVRLVGKDANLFCKVILEAEDGARADWSVRYRGTETVTYANGPARTAERLEATNPWSIGWTRRIVDYDAQAGEMDEEKKVSQRFAARLELIDGRVVEEAQAFQRSVPTSATSTWSFGVSAKADWSGRPDDPPRASFEGGLRVGDEKTYDTTFTSLVDSDGIDGLARSIGRAPCPSQRTWDVTTSFECELSVEDLETFSGSKGARQELAVTIVNTIDGVIAERCHGCGAPAPRDPLPPPGPLEPSDPCPVPSPTTPGDPMRPITPSSLPVPPTPTPPTSPMPTGTDAPTSPAGSPSAPGAGGTAAPR